MKNILIVEDESTQANGLNILLKTYNPEFNIYIATNSAEAKSIYEQDNMDLFLLDVDLSRANSDASGIDIGLTLRNHPQYANTPIIYITGIPEKIHEAVNDVHCFSYLSKPYNQNSINKALDDIINSKLQFTPSFVFPNTDGIHISIDFKDVHYIRLASHFAHIYTKKGMFTTRTKYFTDYKDKLPYTFIQIHRAYIVNIQYISTYDKVNRYIRINKTDLSVSRNFKHNFETIYFRGGSYGI